MMSWFTIEDEDELKEGKYVLKMNPDLWRTIVSSEDPRGLLAERILEGLRIDRGWDEFEVQAVREDAHFTESVGEEYQKLERRFRAMRKPPRTVVVSFGLPASRDAKGRSTEVEERPPMPTLEN